MSINNDLCLHAHQCPITHQRMIDPVIASDGYTYEREAVQKWLKTKSTSPMTNEQMDDRLTTNQIIKTQIKEWLDENTCLHGLRKQLEALHGAVAMASTPTETLDALGVIGKLVSRAKEENICILSPKGVGNLRLIIKATHNLSEEVTNALNTLEQQCIGNVSELKEFHVRLGKRYTHLQQVKDMGGGDKKLKSAAAAAKKRQASVQDKFDAVKRELDAATEANTKKQKALEHFKNKTSMVETLMRELQKKCETTEQQLVCMEELVENGSSSLSSSSSSLTAVGSKRNRSSTSLPSSSKRRKKEDFLSFVNKHVPGWKWKIKKKLLSGNRLKMTHSVTSPNGQKFDSLDKLKIHLGMVETPTEHPGQWLYEEGMAYYYGSDFKKEDEERGRMIIEVSASSGFPMAVAYCHFYGWNGLEMDCKKGFEMYLKIEKETNGYHWAQRCLGVCYRAGYGTEEDDDKCFEFETKAAEQGNGLAMHGLGICYKIGQGCEKNDTKSFEWHEKSAQLGDSHAMYWCGVSYKDGTGVTKDVNKAKEWLTKAAAQNNADAREALDELNGVEEEEGEEGDWL